MLHIVATLIRINHVRTSSLITPSWRMTSSSHTSSPLASPTSHQCTNSSASLVEAPSPSPQSPPPPSTTVATAFFSCQRPTETSATTAGTSTVPYPACTTPCGSTQAVSHPRLACHNTTSILVWAAVTWKCRARIILCCIWLSCWYFI